MKRTTLVLFAIMLTSAAGLGFGAAPAAAYVGDYTFSDRGGERAAPRAQRRSARNNRASRQRTVSHRAAPAARRSARRGGADLASLTGGGMQSSGMASYYWQGQQVASGGRFNPNGMTAAHRTLPFGTQVRVTNVSNGRSVVVTINDRGPFVGGRIIDLSRGAASVIGMTGAGVARVNMAVLGR